MRLLRSRLLRLLNPGFVVTWPGDAASRVGTLYVAEFYGFEVDIYPESRGGEHAQIGSRRGTGDDIAHAVCTLRKR